ncbi:MAG: archaeosortase/exosortase family protein [Ignisphaera sp.]
MDSDRLYKIVVLILVAIALATTLYMAYRDYLYAYIRLMFTEDYSYLVVALPIAIGVFLKLVLDRFSIEGINVFRAVSSIMFLSTAITFYVIGEAVTEVHIELKTLSIVFLLWSFLALFLRSRKLVMGILSMMLLLVLVPIPRPIMDGLSSFFTDIVARTVAHITSAKLIESNGMIVLITKDPTGIERSFEIAPICSGIVSFLSLLSIAPLVIYLSSTSSASIRKRAMYTTLSIVSAILIVFIGNISRLVLIIVVTRTIGFEKALKFFHYTPSILYVVIATALSLYIISKLSRQKAVVKPYTVSYIKPSIAFSGSIAFLLFIAIVFNVLAPMASTVTLAQTTPSVISLPKLLENPTTIVLNSTDIFLFKDVPEPRLGTVLGIPIIRSIAFMYNNTLFLGYIEVADVPTKFHGWYVCVTLQGYRIHRSWTELGNITINHMLISKSGNMMLLSYTIYRYILQEGTTYIRLSIMTPVSDDYSEQVQMARDILGNVRSIEIPRSRTTYVLDLSMTITNISVVIGFALLILHHLGKYLQKLYIRRPREKEGLNL